MLYWIQRGVWEQIIATTEDERVALCISFREPADLIASVRDWAAGYSRPEEWDGDYFEQMDAEGADEDEIEAARAEIDELRRRYYDLAGETPAEILGWLEETAPHLFR